jgi:hypothetical protein
MTFFTGRIAYELQKGLGGLTESFDDLAQYINKSDFNDMLRHFGETISRSHPCRCDYRRASLEHLSMLMCLKIMLMSYSEAVCRRGTLLSIKIEDNDVPLARAILDRHTSIDPVRRGADTTKRDGSRSIRGI